MASADTTSFLPRKYRPFSLWTQEIFDLIAGLRPNITGKYLITEHKTYLDLKYTGNDGDYLIFELPTPHPGHEHFQGCSGAPIIDKEGNTVALVCKGDIATNRIYGISLKRYQVAIDATYGEMSKST